MIDMEKDFYGKLKNLCATYEQVKSAIILVENFDEERRMYIAPINQLRSALDHIFKAVCIAQETENCDYELKEAKEHMERAGYDALELLAGSLGVSIGEKLKPYDTETLTAVFPDYYTLIKPEIIEIKKKVAEFRLERKTDSEKTFLAYFEEIKELVEFNKLIDRMIPSLQDYSDKKAIEKRKEEKNSKRQRLWQYFVGFVSAAIIAMLAWVLSRYC
jgi:hypothetical protein